MVLTTTGDFHLFWTACNPLDFASGSITALGIQRNCVTVAGTTLPTLTFCFAFLRSNCRVGKQLAFPSS